MQFLKGLVSRFKKSKLVPVCPADFPKESRTEILRDLRSVQAIAVSLRVYLRTIKQAETDGTRVIPLVAVKAAKLQKRLGVLVYGLQIKGVSMDLIEDYVERGSSE